METTAMAITMRGVEQQQAHFRLGPLDLDIAEGFVTAIVGPNGSGKSTTFRLLLDLAKPTAGQMQVLGQKVGESDDRVLKRQLGYLAEEANREDDSMRGTEKAAFVRRWYPQWDVNFYREILQLFEVDDSLKLGKMSKGMRRKYELALIMAHKPKLLLLDEPSSGLDPIAWKSMIKLLHRYMEPGDRTIVMSSHIIDEVRRLADYIVFMARGQVLGIYEKDELFQQWQVLFVQAGDAAAKLAAMAGVVECAEAGSGIYRIVTEQSAATERALQEAGHSITSRQTLQLDDILELLMRRGAFL
ncbi:ABC transporter ATP-binding protein [Paenibacillus sp. MMS18-CY102]|uniref:ABC transporter ATP-binding protein n=1 Tax=Paenibacillus sp. MMS18-CY102 TaxID=2682849 RepID=UPI0013657DA4|nr:ABC transporter ATP-binding protein [Paenibacillus sp. MMS18-CY102]MWC30363.1 ATP-binding cassette domain-containing protein [Paenibacillus sp. MMS18-CY102]